MERDSMPMQRGQLRKYNRYQDVEIDASMLPHDEISKFLSALNDEESKWLRRLEHNARDVNTRTSALFWVKVGVRLCHLLPPLMANGSFTVHHATPGHVMLVKGPGASTLPPPSMPLYGTHYARVECMVVGKDSGGRYNLLVVTESVGTSQSSNKFVTGSVEPGEQISDAAEREVMEETRVPTKFERLLGVINRLCTRFGRDEILVGCLMSVDRPIELILPIASSGEIRRAQWVSFEDFERMADVSYVARAWYESYRGGNALLVDSAMPDIRGHGHVMSMYVPTKKELSGD